MILSTNDSVTSLLLSPRPRTARAPADSL